MQQASRLGLYLDGRVAFVVLLAPLRRLLCRILRCILRSGLEPRRPGQAVRLADTLLLVVCGFFHAFILGCTD